MDNAVYVALSRATALERNLSITANNIANADTAGFKAEQAVFESYVESQRHAEVKDSVSFVVDGGSFVDLRQGGLTATGGALDLGIEGPGWFAYRTESGQTVLGRDGQFALDADGTVVTTTGAKLLDVGGGPIALPEGAEGLSVARDGTISAADGAILGQVGVFAGGDIQSYTRLGAGMFAAPGGDAQLEPLLGAQVVQGALEQSNVNAVFEVTRLIELHRAYEQSLKVVENRSDLSGQTLQRLGQPT